MSGQDVVALHPESSDSFLSESEGEGSSRLLATGRSQCYDFKLDGCSWQCEDNTRHSDGNNLEKEEGELSESEQEALSSMSMARSPLYWLLQGPKVCLLTDKTGFRFNCKDKLLNVIHVVTSEMDVLAKFITDGVLVINQDIVLVMMGLQTVFYITKAKLKSSLLLLTQAIKNKQPGVRIGYISLTADFETGDPKLGVKIVNYNRNLCTAVGVAKRVYPPIAYLPMHLHFQQDPKSPGRVPRFVDPDGTLTDVGALDMRLLLLRECHISITP